LYKMMNAFQLKIWKIIQPLIRRPQRSDSGLFKLSVKNSGGIDSADIEVAVVSAPNQPTGPLDVQDVTGSSCHLNWKAPMDDGGDKITHYLVERRDNRNNIWQPSGKCLATHTAVSDLSNGLDYIFRVKAVNSEGDSPFLQAENMVTAKDPYRPPGPPCNLHATDVGAKWVELKWDKPASDGGAPISNYVIERKDPLTRTFIQVSETMSGLTENTVTGLKDHSVHTFRVRGVNKSGTGEPSPQTTEIECKDKVVKFAASPVREEDSRQPQPLSHSMTMSVFAMPPEDSFSKESTPEQQPRSAISLAAMKASAKAKVEDAHQREQKRKIAEEERRKLEEQKKKNAELSKQKEKDNELEEREKIRKELQEKRKQDKERMRLEKEKRMEEEKQKLAQLQREAEEKKLELEKRQTDRENERKDKLMQAQMKLDKEREEAEIKRKKMKEEQDRIRKEEMAKEKQRQEQSFLEEQERLKQERDQKVKERN